MTNEVKLFNNEMFGEVMVVTFKDQPMFVAKEIAMILGYSATGAMNKIIDEEDKFKHTIQNGTNYVNQSLITESGLYHPYCFTISSIYIYIIRTISIVLYVYYVRE